MSISVIVLLDTQYSDFPEYLIGLDQAFRNIGEDYEIVVIANGTGNFFRAHQNRFFAMGSRLRAFEFVTPVTQAVSLKAILKETHGDILVICGSYQQLTDRALKDCLLAIDETTDLVSPWREKRVDPSFNQLQSRIFNWMTRCVVKTDMHDFSCTVKVCRRLVLEEIDLYGNMFRFLPVLAEARGFKTREIPVEHYQERGKTGFYNVSEYISRLLDIFTLFFNTRFSRKPLRFFSFIGVACISIGILLMGGLFAERLFFEVPIGNRPMLLASLLLTILGVLVSGAGLLGEIIAFANGRHKKEYVIEKKI